MASLTMRLNADVLHLVFGHLDDLAQSNQRGKALVNAAMTCKNFYQPALRIIWRKLDDLFPLFKLFSSFVMVRTVQTGQRKSELFTIDGAILPGEWERFRMHAEFVHILRPSPRPPAVVISRRIAPAALSCLNRLTGGTPLLPNLRILHWIIPSTQCTTLFSLISPSIGTLTIVHRHGPIGDEQREWQALVRSTLFLVASVATHITDLNLDWSEEYSIGEAVAQLRFLRCFEATRADGNLLRALAGLPSLKTLTLGTILVSEKDTFMSADEGFTHLKSFSVNRHPNTSRFYQLFNAAGLQCLVAKFPNADDHRDIRMCCTAWAKSFPSLEELILGLRVVTPNADDASNLPRSYSSILEPLFQLRTLTSVDVSASCEYFVPNDADIEAAARSWPELANFSARHRNPYVWDLPEFKPRMEQEDAASYSIGPSAIVLLASRCPQLCTFQIPRAAIHVENLDALSNFPVLNHRLNVLSIDHLSVNDCALAALFIDQPFPHIRFLSRGWSGNTGGDVKHHVRVCQRARQHAAQRMALSALAASTTFA